MQSNLSPVSLCQWLHMSKLKLRWGVGENSKIKKWFLVPLRVLSIERSHSRSFSSTLKGIEPKTVSVSSCVVLELVPLKEEKQFQITTEH